ncbi:MAG: hypothetical protein K2Y32_03205 [Candidatus Obscuribacterales bacterium]|nr:hypothetical protein [Candidatus Obscuribacterales bacterium]
MAKKKLQKIVSRIAKDAKIDGKEAKLLTEQIYADGFVSRTERRLVGKLLNSDLCDENVKTQLSEIVAN